MLRKRDHCPVFLMANAHRVLLTLRIDINKANLNILKKGK